MKTGQYRGYILIINLPLRAPLKNTHSTWEKYIQNRKTIGPLIALLLALGPTGVIADAASHRQAVEKLFELTRMQEKIDTSVNNVVAMQLNQDPAMREHEALLRDYMERQIGWSGLKGPLTEMYLQAFTEPELIEINAFYGSPAGSKMIKRLPELIKQRDQLAMQRMQENIGELRSEIEAQKAKQQP
ncbi:MAG: DUF2059 domain-containing protein [Gammaproteobacteria bacterium]|nr:DUF2059 domain-containing protein [Gammaproteobacteria bacterium]